MIEITSFVERRNPIVLLGVGVMCAFSSLSLYSLSGNGTIKFDMAPIQSAADMSEQSAHDHRNLQILLDPKTVVQVSREAPTEKQNTQLVLPNILFLGAQKAGSSSIASWLFEAGVCRAQSFPGEPAYFSKEAHFFDKDDRFVQGVEFYAQRFQHCLDRGNAEFIMDATPDYLTYPERIFNVYINAGNDALSRLKLMVVLREPISRELSLCNHKIANRGPITFEQHVDDVLRGKPNSRWASTGQYVDHLRKFLSFIRREQLLVLSYDELKTEPQKTQWRIGQFLGSREFPGKLPILNMVDSPDKITVVSPLARQMLEPLFKDKNEELYEFLEMHPGPWMEERPFPHFS